MKECLLLWDSSKCFYVLVVEIGGFFNLFKNELLGCFCINFYLYCDSYGWVLRDFDKIEFLDWV